MSPQIPVHYFSYDKLAELLVKGLPNDTSPETIKAIVDRLSDVHAKLEKVLTARTMDLLPNATEEYKHEHTAQVIALAIQLEIRYRQLPAEVTALVEIARAALMEAPVGKAASA